MSASESNEQTAAVFRRIEEMVGARGVAIQSTVSGAVLKLEFADGQRILVSHDAQTGQIWLAALFAGTEYAYHNGRWTSRQDGSELFARIEELIDQLIRSNPVNVRQGQPVTSRVRAGIDVQPAQVPEPRGDRLKALVLLGVLAWLGYLGFHHFGHKPPTEGGSLMAAVEEQADGACDAAIPENGATRIFPASNIQADNPDDTEITVSNDHSHAFLAIFTAPKTVIPYLSVLVQAGQSAKVRLPAGQYDLLFSVGDTWCNTSSGFSDGTRIKLSTTIDVLPAQPMQLGAQSSGTGAADFQVFIRSSAPEPPPPATQFMGNGAMEIRQHSDGHFHIAGSVNGIAITFLVDTGASVTSLTSDTANRAGVLNCRNATFKTANGTIDGCIGTVAQLTIGDYQIQNAAVAVMPNLEVDLLGMNVLSHFQISQADGIMRLSGRSTSQP